MRVVVVARVRNEEDVVEPFVRHHCALLGRMVVLDDGSTDRTPEILRALGDEGLPVRLLREDRIGNSQGVSTTALMRDAFAEGADWVVPLDADEFFEARDAEAFGRLLAAPTKGVVEMPWDNFVLACGQPNESNPVVRMDWHTPTRRLNCKVIVPRLLGSGPGARLYEGNHYLYVGGRRMPSDRHPCVRLCHYPVRSVGQYASKVAIGMARYAMMADRDPGWAFHYRAPYEALLTDWDAFSRMAVEDSRNYSLGPGEPRDQEVAYGPLAYAGGALRYTREGDRLVQNLAGAMHQMALAMARPTGAPTEGHARADPSFARAVAAFLGRLTPSALGGRSRRG